MRKEAISCQTADPANKEHKAHTFFILNQPPTASNHRKSDRAHTPAIKTVWLQAAVNASESTTGISPELPIASVVLSATKLISLNSV